MPTHKRYHSYLIQSLQNPVEAAAYLDSALEDGDLDYLLLALKNVAEARRTAANIANESDVEWERCYQSLAQGETPTLQAIAQLLNKLGLKLSVTIKPDRAA